MHTAEHTATPAIRELDSRLTNGLQVRLLWSQLEDRLFVLAFDRATGDMFCLTVAEDEDPLEVFNHPFAYAARRGIQLGGGDRRAPLETSA